MEMGRQTVVGGMDELMELTDIFTGGGDPFGGACPWRQVRLFVCDLVPLWSFEEMARTSSSAMATSRAQLRSGGKIPRPYARLCSGCGKTNSLIASIFFKQLSYPCRRLGPTPWIRVRKNSSKIGGRSSIAVRRRSHRCTVAMCLNATCEIRTSSPAGASRMSLPCVCSQRARHSIERAKHGAYMRPVRRSRNREGRRRRDATAAQR